MTETDVKRPQPLPPGVKRIFGHERPRYYVWRIDGPPPSRLYHSRWYAEQAAGKLADLYPEAEFAVLKVKAIMKAKPEAEDDAPTGE